MDDEPRFFKIDERLESYRDFFSGDWAKQFITLTERTKLKEPGFDLTRYWKGVSRSHALPWLLSKVSDDLLRHELEANEPLSVTKLHFINSKLTTRLKEKGENLRPMFYKVLQNCIDELDAEASRVVEHAREVTIDSLTESWPAFLNDQMFAATIWSLERMCYAAFYYYYECFLTDCMRIKLANPGFRIRNHDRFKLDFKAAFGPELQQSCWSSQQVVIARYARHALLHNGGRITQDLARQPHPFQIQDEEVQIMAPETASLFALLKDKVMELATSAVKMSEFQMAN